MNELDERKLLDRASALMELRRVRETVIPQSIRIAITKSGMDKLWITLTRDPGHADIFEDLADKAFRKKLTEGLFEYNRLIAELIEPKGEE